MQGKKEGKPDSLIFFYIKAFSGMKITTFSHRLTKN